jgi:hypothetical protein
VTTSRNEPKIAEPHGTGAKCTAKAKSTGERCGKPPVPGATTCRIHGGAAPQVRRAAEERIAVQQAEEAIARLVPASRVVADPLRELQVLAGEVLGWKELLARQVAELQAFTVGEHSVPRGEVVLFERALDRCTRTLVEIGKLDIDRRLLAIEAQRVEVLRAGMAHGLAAYNAVLGLTAEQEGRVPEAAEAMRRAAGEEIARRMDRKQVGS